MHLFTLQLHFNVKMVHGGMAGTLYAPSLSYHSYLVCPLFGMPSLQFFTFLMFFNVLFYVYVIAWFAMVFGINSTSNAEIIVRGAAEYNLLHYDYECY